MSLPRFQIGVKLLDESLNRGQSKLSLNQKTSLRARGRGKLGSRRTPCPRGSVERKVRAQMCTVTYGTSVQCFLEPTSINLIGLLTPRMLPSMDGPKTSQGNTRLSQDAVYPGTRQGTPVSHRR